MIRFNLFGSPPAVPPTGEKRRGRIAIALAGGAVVLGLLVVPEALGVAETFRMARALRVQAWEAEQAPAELRRLSTELEQAGSDQSLASGLPALLAVLRESADGSGARLERVEPGDADEGLRSVRVRVSGDGHAIGRFVDAVERGGVSAPVQRLVVEGGVNGRTIATIELYMAVSEQVEEERLSGSTSNG